MFHSFVIRLRSMIFCKRRFLLLAFVWFLGLESGKFYAGQASNTYLLLMRAAALCRPSIIGLAVSVLVPLLITIGSVYFSRPSVIYVLAFLWAALFGYSSACLRLVFGSADWLIRILFLFSHCFSAPLLCWLMIRNIYGIRPSFLKESLIVILIALTIGSVDYFVISPFLAALIS